MQRGFRILTISGIEIKIDWSWALIFLLISWNLSVYFGFFHPEWSTVYRWGLAVAAAVLFFLSILAHELAHSFTARAQGLNVRSITLFFFGGISNIEREPPSPKAEFLITILGPLSSLVIGGILLLLVPLVSGLESPLSQVASAQQAQDLLAQLSPVALMMAWLGTINIFLGLFNLVPGFPLDGGRIVRSILWAISGSLRRATRWASYAGQAVAWLMILTGVAMLLGLQVPILGGGAFNGLWLAFIGWFLNGASVQSYRQVVIRDILEEVPVSKIMRSDPPSISGNRTIDSLVHEDLMGSDDQAFPVVEDGKLVGIITLDDVRKIERARWEQVSVKEGMTPVEELTVVDPEDDSAEAFARLSQLDVRQLPVVENGKLCGLLRRRDIVRWLKLHSDTGNALA